MARTITIEQFHIMF